MSTTTRNIQITKTIRVYVCDCCAKREDGTTRGELPLTWAVVWLDQGPEKHLCPECWGATFQGPRP